MATEFQERVYALVRKIPAGKVTTYKELAHNLGTGAYRAVGSALAKNPYAPEVPCHRVIASDRSIGGFAGSKSGPDVERKQGMLEAEGVTFENGRVPAKLIFTF